MWGGNAPLLFPSLLPPPAKWHQHLWRVCWQSIQRSLVFRHVFTLGATHVAFTHTHTQQGKGARGGDDRVAIETVLFQVWSVRVIKKKKVAMNYCIRHIWCPLNCLNVNLHTRLANQSCLIYFPFTPQGWVSILKKSRKCVDTHTHSAIKYSTEYPHVQYKA